MATEMRTPVEPKTENNAGKPAEGEAAPSKNFIETALKLSGKSEEEARKTGTLDRADEQVEALFEFKYQSAQSPVHQSVWTHHIPV